MKRSLFLAAVMGLCWAAAACGEDDGLDLANAGADAGFTGDRAGSDTAGAAGTAASANAGAESFNDAGADWGNDAGFPVVSCDNAAQVTECNGVPCAGPDPFAVQSCRVTCCTAELQCGILASDGETCVAPAYSPGGCPSIVSTLGTVSDLLAGCCTELGTCGGVAFGQCVDRVKLGHDMMVCPDLLDADGGTTP